MYYHMLKINLLAENIVIDLIYLIVIIVIICTFCVDTY